MNRAEEGNNLLLYVRHRKKGIGRQKTDGNFERGAASHRELGGVTKGGEAPGVSEERGCLIAVQVSQPKTPAVGKPWNLK